jgi:hypothetical protein
MFLKRRLSKYILNIKVVILKVFSSYKGEEDL